MKKRVAKLMAFLCGVSCLGTITSCNQENIVNDGKTVNIRVYLGGYGTDWLYDLQEKFETAYAEEGYKLNILIPAQDNSASVVVNELAAGNSGVDLYFTESVWVQQVTNGEYGMLVEDLSDLVYSKPAIGFDGKEESVSIRDKVKMGIMNETNTYYNDKEYGFCWIASAGGLCYNEAKLALYGLETPNTTDELLTCFDVIYNGTTLPNGTKVGGSKKTALYPHTYLTGSSGYPLMMYMTWMAQYMGYDVYQQFMSFCDENGQERIADGYELYKEEGILKMLEVAYQAFDLKYAQGSMTQSAGEANSRVVKDNTGAVFMSNGSWMLNEVSLDYPNQAKNLRCLNFPVISALGEKVFGAGTTANITDATVCDKVLSKTVELIDAGKTNEEIVTELVSESVTVLAEDVARIREARYMYFSRSYTENAYIAKNSPVKDVAALLLRMYASDDNAKLFAEKSGATTPFDKNMNIKHTYEFCNDVAKIVNNPNSIALNSLGDVVGLRKKLNQGTDIIVGSPYLAVKITQDEISKYDENGELKSGENGTNTIYANAAKALYERNYQEAQNKWSSWLSLAGLN